MHDPHSPHLLHHACDSLYVYLSKLSHYASDCSSLSLADLCPCWTVTQAFLASLAYSAPGFGCTLLLCWAQLCPTLCDPMDCSLPGSSVHGILQARILEWVTIPFSRGSSQPRNQIWGLLHCRQILYSPSHKGSLIIQKSVGYRNGEKCFEEEGV